MTVVDVSGWELDPQFPFHPQGKKPKKILTAPLENVVLNGIIPGHRYLFKLGHGWRSHQVWSEYIAYQLGELVHHPVPPCFIAIDGSGNTGALIEFFYGFPGEEAPAQFVHAAEILSGFHRTLATGRPNNFVENVRVSRVVLGPGPWLEWWAAAAAFDALIGNTDRHTENWGVLARRSTNGSVNYSLAPLYDNGTSLGYQMPESRLADASSASSIEEFVENGLNELGWDMRDDSPLPHFTLLDRILLRHPQTRTVLERFARFQMPQINAILAECTGMDASVRFSPERASFVSAQIAERQQRLIAVLGT